MSNYDVIRGVTSTLREILRDRITNSAEAGLTGVGIDLHSPKEMREAGDATGVSLWLYRAVRDGHILNHPPRRDALGRLVGWSLPVNLYYLITPVANAPEDEHLLLGRVLQAFNDAPTLRGPLLQGSLNGGPEAFRLTIEPLTLEQLTRVWDALKEPYALSVNYQVQVLSIDSETQPTAVSPVSVSEHDYVQIKSVS